jgi:hypothetical protein
LSASLYNSKEGGETTNLSGEAPIARRTQMPWKIMGKYT